MRAKLPWILLAISLVLNVFAVGGFFYGKRMAEHRYGERSPIIAGLHALDLEGPQKATLERLRADLRRSSGEARDRMRPLRRELLTELMKPQPDVAAIDARIDSLGAMHNERYKAMVRAVFDFHQTLTPAQRDAFRKGVEDNLKRRDERRTRREGSGR